MLYFISHHIYFSGKLAFIVVRHPRGNRGIDVISDAWKLVFDANPNQTRIETASCNAKIGKGALSHGRITGNPFVAIEEQSQVWKCGWQSLCVSISRSGTRLAVSLA
jgi:hypothetical protein